MSKTSVDKAVFVMEMCLQHRVPSAEAEAIYEAMRDMKRSSARMRIEFVPIRQKYRVHDLSENKSYTLDPANIPEWVKESMALLSLVEPQTDVAGVGFFYDKGIFYLDIKSAIPKDIREEE